MYDDGAPRSYRARSALRPIAPISAFRALRLPGMAPKKKRPRRLEYEPEAGDTSSGDGYVGNNTARAAGAKLLKHFLGLYACSKMTAKDFCVSCHYAAVAGTPGAQFDLYALGPDLPSGHYQRHLDIVLPGPGTTYQFVAPASTRRTSARDRRTVTIVLPHESVAAELRETPLPAAWPELPPAYHDHPVTRDCAARGQQPPVPVAVYIDGVRYSAPGAGRSDSIIGYWIVNLLSQRRHLVAAVRSLDQCRCGCRGWCSTQPLLQVLAWSLQALADGRRPSCRHDGTAFEVDDPCQKALDTSGAALPRAALIWVKGDWAEMSHTLALQPVTCKHAPCPFCTATGPQLHVGYKAISAASLPWGCRQCGDYEAGCAACEIVVTICGEAH